MLRGFLAIAVLLTGWDEPRSDPISLLPANPHYFRFRGKPTILLTSGEHYGAVLNLDFDIIPYLDSLARNGFNQTRTFSGTYREVPGSFRIRRNTLAPAPNRYQAPWIKVANASEGMPERFDLDRFDLAYFERLKQFVTEAGKRGIVVELVLFCPLYEQNLWDVNPMNARNNSNGVGNCPREEVFSLKHEDLLVKQLAYVSKVATELNAFDNLYYEICNEPYFGGVTLDWQKRVAETLVATENLLANKHMIAQNIANEKAKVDQPVHPAVSLLNFHYADPAAALENYGLNLAIGDDETGFRGTSDRPYRTEAWLFLLSGGGEFSNLDYSYTPEHEDGSATVKDPTPGGGGDGLRKQLAFLKRFLEGFELERMRPVVGGFSDAPQGAKLAALIEPGRQYALYVDRGGGQATLKFDLPPGRYRGTWVDPLNARDLRSFELNHERGVATFRAPEYKEDIALRIVGIEEPKPCIDPIHVGTDDGLNATAQLAATLPRLKVSDNHRYLVNEEGTPFFYLGDTAWELFHRLTREEAEIYLKDRSDKGFTVIQAVVLAEFDGLATPNFYGARPLQDNDPSKPNEEYFEHVDFIVDKAESLGLHVGMLPTWGDKVNKKWGVGPEIFNPQNARVFGEFIGKRYKNKPIIWILGGDRPVENETQRAIWDAMAEGLRAGDGGTHLITYHPMGGQSSAQFFADAPWIDFHMIQSGHAQKDYPNYDMITRDYSRVPIRPVLDAEPRYEDHPINWDSKNGYFDAHDVRKAAYWSVFAGACGVTYGCHDIWQFFQEGRTAISQARTPWREALNQPASGQMRHLKRLVESRPYFERVPDQSLIAGDPRSGGDHLQACRGAQGTYCLVYLPTTKPITIDLSKLKGNDFSASWYNPRDGQKTAIGRVQTEGKHEFKPPTEGPDWVLLIDAYAREAESK